MQLALRVALQCKLCLVHDSTGLQQISFRTYRANKQRITGSYPFFVLQEDKGLGWCASPICIFLQEYYVIAHGPQVVHHFVFGYARHDIHHLPHKGVVLQDNCLIKSAGTSISLALCSNAVAIFGHNLIIMTFLVTPIPTLIWLALAGHSAHEECWNNIDLNRPALNCAGHLRAYHDAIVELLAVSPHLGMLFAGHPPHEECWNHVHLNRPALNRGRHFRPHPDVHDKPAAVCPDPGMPAVAADLLQSLQQAQHALHRRAADSFCPGSDCGRGVLWFHQDGECA